MDNKKIIDNTISALKDNAEILMESLALLKNSVESLGEREEEWFKEIEPKLDEATDELKDAFVKNFWSLVYMVDKYEQISRKYKMENSNKILDILDKLNEISVR